MTATPEPFVEDMSLKARWFFEIRGTKDEKALNRLRDKAVEHVEVMRKARVNRLDPGGGAISESLVLVGAGRKVSASTTRLPGHVESAAFVTTPIEVKAEEELLSVTLKQKVRRGARTASDIRTARMFRFDPEREGWDLVEASGWNAKDGYVWGRVDGPGVYAAVALPKSPEEVRRLAFESFARRTIRTAVEAGHFARAEDFADRDTFRSFYVDTQNIDPGTKAGRGDLNKALAVHREALRELKGAWSGEPLGGRPEWQLLDDTLVRLPELAESIGLVELLPWYPTLWKVADRIGPWFPLGPLNINGRVKSLAIHPTNGDILYAGSANGGLWKSTDAGQTWRHLWTFQQSLAVGAIEVAPSSPNTVFTATGEDTPGWGPGYGGVGIYKSTDAGTTWTLTTGTSVLGARCNKIVVHPTNAQRLFVASETGVHRSTNGGTSFTTVLAGHATDVVMAHDNPDVLYAGLWNNGVYKTTDGGASWTRIEGSRVVLRILFFTIRSSFPTGTNAGWIKLAIGRSGPAGSNFVVAKLGKDSATTLATQDGGNEWQPLSGSVGADYDEWTSMVGVHPRDSRHIYLGSVGLQHTTNGATFATSPGTHSDHHQIVFHPTNDNVAFIACDGGVYRTTNNGTSWHLRSAYLQGTQLMSLGVAQQGTLVIGSATQDQGIIQTDGSPWWVDNNGGNEWGMFVVDPNDSRNIFISPGGGQLRRSTNTGLSYTNPTNGLTDWWAAQNRATVAASFAHAAVKPGDSGIVIGVATVKDEVKDAAGNVTATYPAKHRIYFSSNGGVNWSNAFTLTARGSRVAFAPSSPTRAYAATSTGRVYRSDASGGSGWTEPATAANRPPAGYITSLTVDPLDRDRVYITYGDVNPHLYMSTDGGATWAPRNGTVASMQLPDIALLDFEVDTESSRVLYAGSDIGVFRSNDRGATWYWANDSLFDRDLPRVPVTGLAIHPGTHRLYASTMGRGLYYTQASGYVSLRAIAVRLSSPDRGIVALRLTSGSRTFTMTRLEVIRRIQAGTEVYVIGTDGTRARVRALQPDSEHPLEYLSTEPDTTTVNNLLSLPRFYY